MSVRVDSKGTPEGWTLRCGRTLRTAGPWAWASREGAARLSQRRRVHFIFGGDERLAYHRVVAASLDSNRDWISSSPDPGERAVGSCNTKDHRMSTEPQR